MSEITETCILLSHPYKQILARDTFMVCAYVDMTDEDRAVAAFIKVSCPELKLGETHEISSNYVRRMDEGRRLDSNFGIRSYRSHNPIIDYGKEKEFDIEGDLLTGDGCVLADTTFKLKIRMV